MIDSDSIMTVEKTVNNTQAIDQMLQPMVEFLSTPDQAGKRRKSHTRADSGKIQ